MRSPGCTRCSPFREIPGHNKVGPVVKDEPCLAEEEVLCVGQAVALIAAETEEQCREAERLLRISYEPLEAVLDYEGRWRGGC